MPASSRPPCLRSGTRLRRSGCFTRAEPLLRAALAWAKRSGGEPVVLAHALNELGLWCKDVGRYAEAREHYAQALRVLRRTGRTDPHDLAALYHNLGGIEHARGHYARGEVLARRGLALRLVQAEPDAAALAADLIALAALVSGLGRLAEAERLYLVGLEMLGGSAGEWEWELEKAVALHGLGSQYACEGRLEEAVGLLQRAATIKRRLLGRNHADLALTLNNLAVAHRRRGDPAAAARLYAEALAIFERALDPDHPKTRTCRRNEEALGGSRGLAIERGDQD
jgi:tetratricopeptide (TPR) repeat protein